MNTSTGSVTVSSTNAGTIVLVTGQQASSVGLAKPVVSGQGVNTGAASVRLHSLHLGLRPRVIKCQGQHANYKLNNFFNFLHI